MVVASIVVLALSVVGLALMVVYLHNRIVSYEKALLLTHWETHVLARFFSDIGIELNWQHPDDLGPEHYEAFRRESSKYLCGQAHTIEVEMQAVGRMEAE